MTIVKLFFVDSIKSLLEHVEKIAFLRPFTASNICVISNIQEKNTDKKNKYT